MRHQFNLMEQQRVASPKRQRLLHSVDFFMTLHFNHEAHLHLFWSSRETNLERLSFLQVSQSNLRALWAASIPDFHERDPSILFTIYFFFFL